MARALDLRWHTGLDARPRPVVEQLLYARLDDFDAIAIHPNEADEVWRVFFKDGAACDLAATTLSLEFGNDLLEFRAVDVPDEDWARRSQAHLRAVPVGRLIVAPPWDLPSSPSDFILIVIDPSTGFGTGHHETTRLCLALLQDLELAARRVIDVGTGSGILAIAAARLGAGEAIALDDDDDALANAAENVARNHVDAIVTLVHADIAHTTLEPAPVVTANLTGAVLRRYAAQLRALVADGGTLIVSGFSPEESTEVVGALGAVVKRAEREGDWAAAALSFPEARS